MLQRTFFVTDSDELNKVIDEVSGLEEYGKARSVLAEIFVNYVERDEAEVYLKTVRERLPRAVTAGISVVTSTGELDAIGVTLSFCFFMSSELTYIFCPASEVSEAEMERIFRDKIEQIGNVKAALCFPAGDSYSFSKAVKRISEGHREIVFFGSMAAVRFAKSMTPDTSFRDLSVYEGAPGSPELRAKYTFSIGEELLDDGIVAVLVSGDELSVQAKYLLGWRPLGKSMYITEAVDMGSEYVCVKTIDGKPAADMYKKYLNVVPDEYFLDNVCEFPVIIRKNGTVIGRVPYFPGEHGELFFSGDVDTGDEIRLSFSHPEELIKTTEILAEDIKEFEPEAIFLTVCYNRYHFLKRKEPREIDCFREFSENLSLCYGGYELLRFLDQGGSLNSAFVVVAFKEDGGSELQDNIEFHPGERRTTQGSRPAYEKLMRFISESTKELEQLRLEAERISKEKTLLLADMSHEIRTQLNAILGMNEMIIRESTNDNVLEFSEDISGAGNTLLGIINDVLDSAKIESGNMEIIPIEYDPVKLTNDLISTVKKPAAYMGIELIIDIDPDLPKVMYGDEVRIKQVVTNLLTNAVKYTERGSVTLAVKKKEEPEAGDDSVILSISVKDTGIGIREEDLHRLFDTIDRKEATRFGLPITRNLLDLMGSRLNVESKHGFGSVFSFDLLQKVVDPEPIGDFETARQKFIHNRKNYRERFTAPDARILVVDDTQMNHNVIKNLLKRTMVQIDTAISGKECLRLAGETKYDVILMDHRMPEMDGVETFKRLRDDKEGLNHDTPVVAVTANTFTNSRDMYFEIGFDNYISKPVSPSILEATLLLYLPVEKVEKDVIEFEPEEPVEGDIPEIMIKAPMIDVEKGIENCGSPEYYMETVRIYLDSAPDNREKIIRYFEKGNIPDYTTKVHALKSSSRIIGVKSIGDLAEKLEKAGNEKDTAFIAEKTPELLQLYRELTDTLDEAVNEFYRLEAEDTEDDKEEITPDKLGEAYSAIRETAQMFDYDSMSMVMGMLDKYRIPDDEKERFDALKKAFRDADWDEINNVLG